MGNKHASRKIEGDGNGNPPTEPGSPNSLKATHGSKSKTSYISVIRDNYQQLINAIIRPPRCEYTAAQLGPREFPFCGRQIQRSDFKLTNARGMSIVCSWWEPVGLGRPAEKLPCVVYMHGNSSSRVECITCLSPVLALGASMLSFDFCGSGQSDGDFVSLGFYEKEDLQVTTRVGGNRIGDCHHQVKVRRWCEALLISDGSHLYFVFVVALVVLISQIR